VLADRVPWTSVTTRTRVAVRGLLGCGQPEGRVEIPAVDIDSLCDLIATDT
jgi:hypothetical protein